MLHFKTLDYVYTTFCYVLLRFAFSHNAVAHMPGQSSCKRDLTIKLLWSVYLFIVDFFSYFLAQSLKHGAALPINSSTPHLFGNVYSSVFDDNIYIWNISRRCFSSRTAHLAFFFSLNLGLCHVRVSAGEEYLVFFVSMCFGLTLQPWCRSVSAACGCDSRFPPEKLLSDCWIREPLHASGIKLLS